MKPKITIIMPIFNAENTLQRALDSMPTAEDIQIILLDDGSTDSSWQIALDWWRNHNTGPSSVIHRWEKNRGVAVTMNLGFSLAKGEYIGSLSSDDWFVADIDQFRPYFDGKNDLVYFDLEVDDGSIWHLDEQSKSLYVGAVKFMRREFLGDTKIPNRKYKEDSPFSHALYEKNPKEVFTGIVAKHYSWPREGSLSWQAQQDYDNDREEYNKNVGIIAQN